jgi:hypothetical protein
VALVRSIASEINNSDSLKDVSSSVTINFLHFRVIQDL